MRAWMLNRPNEPMIAIDRSAAPGPGEVLIEVAGCGVCHTDLAFASGQVPTRHALPLTLGHEISGRVVAAGADAEPWNGRAVIVPAVIPCGRCGACRAGRGAVCREQVFPGNDVHGGFATHVVVPSRGLCPVPDLSDRRLNPSGVDLPELSVIADAISTPFEAIERAGLAAGDLAVFVGVGGIGSFGAQLAAARGAAVVAIDKSAERLELISRHGASRTLDAAAGFPALRDAVRSFAGERGIPSWRWFVFETSGTAAGQATAFGLLGHGSYLAVVGFTPQKVELRLSNLMALDATARGNWGCAPERYPAVLELVLAGSIALGPFTERRPLSSIDATFADVHAGRVARRVILVPGS
jgi:6-hydroxycyclohex-1-ene-1-carbonyl-CoA dehydrogenase